MNDVVDTVEESNDRRIVIPYIPRKHFIPLHRSKKRWKFVVAHRRAGKSVAEINETIRQALENDREYPPPRYGYVGPSFAQTKDLIWGYAKHYTAPLRNEPARGEAREEDGAQGDPQRGGHPQHHQTDVGGLAVLQDEDDGHHRDRKTQPHPRSDFEA